MVQQEQGSLKDSPLYGKPSHPSVLYYKIYAQVVELVDTRDLKSLDI